LSRAAARLAQARPAGGSSHPTDDAALPRRYAQIARRALRQGSTKRSRQGSAPFDDAALPRRYAQAGLSHVATGLSPARPAGQRPDRRRGFAAALSYSRDLKLFSFIFTRLVPPMPHRHCERSEAIQGCHPDALDCVATLAMTVAPRMSRHRATVSTFITFARGARIGGEPGATPNHRRPGLEPGPRFLPTEAKAELRLKAGVTEVFGITAFYRQDGPLPAVRATTAHPEPQMLSHPASVSTFATFARVTAA